MVTLPECGMKFGPQSHSFCYLIGMQTDLSCILFDPQTHSLRYRGLLIGHFTAGFYFMLVRL